MSPASSERERNSELWLEELCGTHGESAYNAAYDALGQLIYRQIYFELHNNSVRSRYKLDQGAVDEMALEWTQDLLLKFLQNKSFETLRLTSTLKTFVATATMRFLIDRFRTQKWHQQVSALALATGDDYGTGDADATSPTAQEPVDSGNIAERSAFWQDYHATLATLPALHAQILQLHVDGYKGAEIAAQLDLHPSKVSRALTEACALVRHHLIAAGWEIDRARVNR